MAAVEALAVPPELAGTRLDRVLTALRPEVSRTRWQRAIRLGLVRINDRIVTEPRWVLRAGDRIRADLPPEDIPAQLSYEPPPVPLDIVYEDAYLLVVAKPRGLVVHPAAGHWHQTLVQALWPAVQGAGGEEWRPGIVHRLDKDTSGLLIVARRADVRQALSDMLARREIHRSYWALVEGRPDPPAGVIDAPIGRHPAHRLKMAVVAHGRAAVTHYRTVATWARYAWLDIELETGRTHQIRVHLAHIGHRVVGDPLYGHAGQLGFPAQALHAWRIRFRHPVTGVALDFTAPWPADWQPALDVLGPPERGQVPRVGAGAGGDRA
jgi:23S rRNA pseudouridine1911/1915/1917 synthase